MIKEAPPSAEPVLRPDVAMPTPDMQLVAHGHSSVANQVHQWMEAEHGRTDEAGLTWEGKDKFGHAKVYVCRGAGTEIVESADPHTGRPVAMVTRERQKVMTGTSDRSNMGRMFRSPWKKVYTPVTEEVEAHYVDIYEPHPQLGSVLVDTKTYHGDEWDAYLDSMTSKPSETTDFWFTPNAETKQPGPDIIEVDTDGGTLESSKAIERTLKEEGLSDWTGLSVTMSVTNGELEQNVILRDISISVPGDISHTAMRRYFEIEVYDGVGDPLARNARTRKLVPATKFIRMLDNEEPLFANPHFLVDRAEMQAREAEREAGKHALAGAISGEHTVRKPGFTPKEAISRLAGDDVFSGDMLERSRDVIKKNPGLQKIAKALSELSELVGADNLEELAGRLHANFVSEAKRIGIPFELADMPLALGADSPNWALWVLAERWQALQLSDEEIATKYPQYAGVNLDVLKVFGDDAEVAQQEIVDNRIGMSFEQTVMMHIPIGQKQVPKRGNSGEILHDSDGNPLMDIVDVVQPVKNDALLKSMKDLGQHERNIIDPLLDRLSPERRFLTPAEQSQIGRVLRKSFVH